MNKTSKTKLPEPPAAPAGEAWRPTWRWHLKVLAGIYHRFGRVLFSPWIVGLSRLPEPYTIARRPAGNDPLAEKQIP